MIIKVQGLEPVLRRLKGMEEVAGRGCERGLKKAALSIFRDAQKQVPVDTGNLKGSGFVRRVSGHGYDAIIGIGYTAEYAIYVHENLWALHGQAYNEAYAELIARKVLRNRGKNQKAKFLEDPAKQHAPNVPLIVQKEIKKAIRKMA